MKKVFGFLSALAIMIMPAVSMTSCSSDDDKEELDVILQEFNEKWFKGWDTTPEEQKVKLTAIVNSVKQGQRLHYTHCGQS